MKGKILNRMGYPKGQMRDMAKTAAKKARAEGFADPEIMEILKRIPEDPAFHIDHPIFGTLAAAFDRLATARESYDERKQPAPFRQWGDDIEPGALSQMVSACRLPVSVRGALMPDAHQGYGLPIGGVLAVRNAVIPYAVGMDIACRMKLSVLDLPVSALTDRADDLMAALNAETRFGVGAQFKKTERREHRVMDADWNFCPFISGLKDKAWSQLGTSGSGNHFAEFGTLAVKTDDLGIAPGDYLALLTHSGSRGIGAETAQRYSRIAQRIHPELPHDLSALAWLDLSSDEGIEYWEIMTLMGRFASANHELIHRYVTAHIGAVVLADVENHHNFAWKEEYDGEEMVVHRKGATPASANALGVIPGSMADPGYVVKGLGKTEALCSASHGAGRRLSRKAALKQYSRSDLNDVLARRGVTLMSAGLDEVPMAYKDINDVMAAQQDLVDIVARFNPKIVKMAD